MSKVFGIGLDKTGTTSLAAALELLGYKTFDYPLGLRDDLSMIEDLDAATDTPVADVFEALDRRWPGSRFVYTVRPDRQAWLDSVRRQWQTSRLEGIADLPQRVALLHRLYGVPLPRFDRDAVSTGYDRHHARVVSYFSGRDDLLVLDLCGGEGWDKLCAFLGRPVPDAPFPRKNVGAGWRRVLRLRFSKQVNRPYRRLLRDPVRKLVKQLLAPSARRSGR